MNILKKILLILGLPLILIGGTNYLFDPDYTLRNNYISPLVNTLLMDSAITGPVNINSRVLKKRWINKLPYLPDVVILGSSRTLALSSQAFPNQTFFNASVTNCTFQDMYIFLDLFENKWGKIPKTVVICADQWLFGNSFQEKRWLINRNEFIEMAKKIHVIDKLHEIPHKWDIEKEWIKELFSVKYLSRSITYHGKFEKFKTAHTADANKMMLLPDGSRRLPDNTTNVSEDKIIKRANEYFYQSKDEYFTQLDKEQCILFEGLINYLTSKNCNIILFIPPYNPVTYGLIVQTPETQGIIQTESYIRKFATAKCTIIGGTNPVPQNLFCKDFYDGVHLKKATLNNLFKLKTNR